MAATNQDREDNMKNIKCKLSLAIIVCATMCLGCKYTYIEVLPPGWKDASAASINDNGDVAGSGIDSTGIQKGFVYSGGNYTELLPPGWSRSIKISGLIIAAELSTTSINNKGTVVMTRRIGILIRNIYVYNIVKSFIATPLQLASHL